MAAGWVVYLLATGALVAVMASAAEGLARAHRRPARWAWAAGLAALLLLGARGWMLERAPGVDVGELMARAGAASSPTLVVGGAVSPLTRVSDAISGVLVRAARLVPAGDGRAALTAWLVASVLVLATLLLVHGRLARLRRAWPRAELHGRAVRIAPMEGPAVLGLMRPDIVVPRWLLGRSADEQRLVLAHEAEHVRAGDHLLLAAAWLGVAVLPWHPAAWWMLARLRLAIELDCDARVLRQGVGARTYGTLLVDLAGQCTGFRVGATALADESSHLKRRLLAMTPNPTRFSHLRTGTTIAVGLLAILAACEAKLPTSAEVQQADVASVERAAQGVKLSVDDAEYYVDGKPATAAEAHAIAANHIVTMNVATGEAGKRSRISIVTGNAELSPDGSSMHMRHAAMTMADTAEMKKLHAEHAMEMKHTFDGVLIIDGVKTDPAAMQALDHSKIATVEVMKGAEAIAASNDPKAANGLIRITTKAAAKQ